MAHPSLIEKVRILLESFEKGDLGGEVMPEQLKPADLLPQTRENLLFLTLPMSLNYRRDSFALWGAAAKTWDDLSTRFVFEPSKVVVSSEEKVREALLKYKLALQPNRHLLTWVTISRFIQDELGGDVRKMFELNNYDVVAIKKFAQSKHKKSLPYLSGPKIFNYWLNALEIYDHIKFNNRDEISIAVDSHVLRASKILGVVGEETDTVMVQGIWKEILGGSGIAPVDVHTPLWLWSRGGFKKLW